MIFFQYFSITFIYLTITKLKEAGYVKFGQRPSIFSTQDGQLCADHDRREGEGVNPQEYTLIKQRVLKPELVDAALAGKNLYLVCATLRPETMYGQTNTFVLPEGEYGVFEMKNDELFILTDQHQIWPIKDQPKKKRSLAKQPQLKVHNQLVWKSKLL